MYADTTSWTVNSRFAIRAASSSTSDIAVMASWSALGGWSRKGWMASACNADFFDFVFCQAGCSSSLSVAVDMIVCSEDEFESAFQ